MTACLRTPAYDWHIAHGGRMVAFGGWDMPVQYSTIVNEHHAVRKAAGLFDISHMGRLFVTGPDQVRYLNHVTTNNVAALQPGQIQYSLVTNAQGGVLDDILVYRFEGFHLVVVNASNRLKIVDWFQQHLAGFDVTLEDHTVDKFMLAWQGPLALGLLQPFVPQDLAGVTYYTGFATEILGQPAIVSRTGYTGEDGFEVILPPAAGLELCDRLLAAGADQGAVPAGLGCRDTLRLEAAMPLYGHELNEQTDPLTAGLNFAVKLDKGPFVGSEALQTIKASPLPRKRIGLQLAGRRIAREGARILNPAGEAVGEVTSGTFSPTLEKSIAMGYVLKDVSTVGTALQVDIRGQQEGATVVKLPFYKRPS